jgi:N-acyl-D-aspartate/D-glutamate deacylase
VASRLASWQEVSQLVDVLGKEGTGTFELAQGPDAQAADPATRTAYFRTLEDLAVSTGVPVTFGTLPVRSRLWDALGCIDATTAAGGRMFGQSHSRGISSVLSFRTSLAFDALPEWQSVRRLPWPEQKDALLDASVRRSLVEAAHRGAYGANVGAEPRRPDFHLIKLFDNPLPPHRSVADAAAERGIDPVELMIDLAVASDFDQLFVQPFADYHDEDIVAVMRHPGTVMTFSDSGAHVSQIMDSSIQTHLLAYWVRERGEFTLADAVHMMTKRAADAWGFRDRGLVREGYVADLNVIDPSTVGPAMPTVEHDLPGGARRLEQRASGIKATIVAGQTVLLDGEHTGALPGRLLRGPWVAGQRRSPTDQRAPSEPLSGRKYGK